MGDGRNSGASLLSLVTNGSIQFTGNSLVETPLPRTPDNGAGQTRQNYKRCWRLYLLKYAPSYNSGW